MTTVVSPDEALQLVYDALTAPLADAEKLKTLDELSTQVQTMVDELGGALNRLALLEEQVRGVDVLAELAKLAEGLKGGGGPARPTQATPVRQPQQLAGPDRGLRRPPVPHQPTGGAVHRGEAVAEHGEG